MYLNHLRGESFVVSFLFVVFSISNSDVLLINTSLSLKPYLSNFVHLFRPLRMGFLDLLKVPP